MRYIFSQGITPAVLDGSRYGWTPLHTAATSGHAEVVAYLIDECGMSVDHDNGDGYSPLLRATLSAVPEDEARIAGLRDTIALLIRKGANAMEKGG